MSKSSPDEFISLLRSHLISNKALQILLKNDFSRDDFLDFIEERKKTIITEIKKLVGCDLSVEEQVQEDPNEVLDEIEIRIRNFIDYVLQTNIGPNYWAGAIPQHINADVELILKSAKTNVPYASEIIQPRKKLDCLDMTAYPDIILNKNNWVYFEKYFLNKENTAKHFKHLSDFRNPVKHNREKQDVIDKLGEAAIMWISGIIKESLSEDKINKEIAHNDAAVNKNLETKTFWDDIEKFSKSIARITYGQEDKGVLKFSLKIDSRFNTQITLFRLKTDGDIKFLFGEIERKNLPEDILSDVKSRIIKIFDNQIKRISAGGAYYFDVSKIINDPEKIADFKKVVEEFVKKVCKQ